MKTQLSHHNSRFINQKLPIVLIADNISGEANIGSLFRLADAFNIEKIIFGGIVPNFSSNRLRKTSRSTYKFVQHEHLEDAITAVNRFKEKGYTIYSLEITKNSQALNTVDFGKDKGLVLVIGNEINGISEEIINASNKCLHINMYGKNSSMNVAHATGIALYEISKSIVPFHKK